jgi:hypothetical protein
MLWIEKDYDDQRKSFAEEQRAYDIWSSHYPQYAIVETDKSRPAVVDALITFENGLYAVVEVKTRRNLTRRKLETQFNNQLLLMHNKVSNCQRLASNLCTRFIVFYYLTDEDTLLVQGIQHADGSLATNLDYGTIDVGLNVDDPTTTPQRAVFVDIPKAKYLQLKKGDTPTTSL